MLRGHDARETMSQASVAAKFGASVRKLRFRLGISQERLGERAELHRTYIAGIEAGGRNITLKNIEKLARALEVSAAHLLSSAEQPASGGAGGRASRAPGPLLDILLVEDNADDAELTMNAFREARMANHVHVALDGAEAVDYIFGARGEDHRRARKPPGLILLDLNLPKISGLDVLRRIKSDPVARTIPVIVLTASEKSRDIVETRRLGVASYLVKPVGFQNLSQVTPQFQMRWALLKPSAARNT
jgi:two-component system response regulator